MDYPDCLGADLPSISGQKLQISDQTNSRKRVVRNIQVMNENRRSFSHYAQLLFQLMTESRP
jgi:hypothetical protein